MKNLFYKLKTITKKHKKTIIVTVIVLILIINAFGIGTMMGGRKNVDYLFTCCHTREKIPYDNYVEFPVGKFDLMHRMFYGENKHKEVFEKVILPKEDITYKEYYSTLEEGFNFEYFITNKGKIKECGPCK
ncbi:hypothetical protein K8R62_02750 [bacterium]|nr:hypothetical protein [bacterium]